MALNAQHQWLICYDVTNPRRLSRLHRFLRRHAVPVQYSVFCYVGSAAQIGNLVPEIDAIIDDTTDDVRIYQLPERLQCDTLGRGSLPDGTEVLSATTPVMANLIFGHRD
jgi:CRISPR-associated protein Cas2